MNAKLILPVAIMVLVCLHQQSSAAVQFDGNRDFEVPSSVAAALEGVEQVSISVRATLDERFLNRRNEILCLTNSQTYSKLVLGFTEDNRLRVGARTRVGEDLQSARTVRQFPGGEKFHIVTVLDIPAGSISIYVNGEREQTEGETSWVAPSFDRAVGDRNAIGASAYRRNHFHGEMSDLLLFARALSEEEVQSLHAEGAEGVSFGGLLLSRLTGELEDEMTAGRPEIKEDWPPMVRTLSGTPREIGAAFGELHRETLQRGQSAWLARGAANDHSREDLLELVAPMIAVVQEIAPHWIEKTEAVAEAAELDSEVYVAQLFYIGPTAAGGREWFRPEEADDCTSYVVSGEFADGGGAIFHRTRDNTPGPQTGAIWETDVPGINRLMAVTYTTSRSISVMVNDKGLVGSADQGGPRSTIRKDVGIMNGLMKRYIAERASNCEEALEIIQRFVDEGWYAGGRPGSRWTLADLDGRILDVSHNSDPGSLTYRWIEGKSHITRTWEGTPDQMLEALAEPVSFLEFRNISRHPDARINRGRNSIAGLTVRVHPEFPEYLTRAWFSFPAVHLAIPLYMGGTATPLPLVDGSLYELCADLQHDFEAWEILEQTLYQNSLLLEARVENLLREGRTAEARELLDDWTQSAAAAHLLYLQNSRR